MRNVSLFWRGVVLTGVPLVFQLVMFAIIISLLIGLQTEIDREAKSEHLTERAEWLFRESFGALTGMNFSPKPGAEDALEFEKSIVELEAKFDIVLKLAEATPEQKAQVAPLHDCEERMRKVTSWIRTERTKGEVERTAVNRLMQDKTMPVIQNFLNVITTVVEVEEGLRKNSRERYNQYRDQLELCLKFAIPISILVSAIVGVFYVVGVRRPLEVITENSRLLSRREPLLTPLGGADELADLDGLFHSVADAVNEALGKERALVDNAADLICSLNENGEFSRANPYSEKLLGRANTDLVGMPLFELVFQDDILTAEQECRDARNSSDLHSFELRLKHQNGRIIDTRWTVFWSDIQKSLFCVVHDITEQKNIDRLKQDFVDMVSHDLRSPLMSMGGTMELIAAGATGELSPAVEKEVMAAQRNIDRLTDFVNDLLDFQKLKAGKMQIECHECDLEQIMAEAVELIRAGAEAKHISVNVPQGHFKLVCDQQKVGQVLVNLVGNAIKFSPNKSQINLVVTDHGETFEIQVEDSGPGVPEQYAQTIFQAFEQVPQSPQRKEGTGLGLAICKLLVEAHGGTIGVRSRVAGSAESRETGTGSVFWFCLPKRPVSQ